MNYTAHITISLKNGMLDPEARAMNHALKNIGFVVDSIKSARKFTITLQADSPEDAKAVAEKMCLKLLANPVIHQYSIEVSS